MSDKTTTDLMNELIKNTDYQDLMEQLPNDERPYIKEFIETLFKSFEENIIQPLSSSIEK